MNGYQIVSEAINLSSELKKIFKTLQSIKYGYIGKDGKRIQSDVVGEEGDDYFIKNWRLATPQKVLQTKLGICGDVVELARHLFETKIKLPHEVHYLELAKNKDGHIFLSFELDSKFYWLENSWNHRNGIHEFNSKKDLLRTVSKLFVKESAGKGKGLINVYPKPKYGIDLFKFMDHCIKKGKTVYKI